MITVLINFQRLCLNKILPKFSWLDSTLFLWILIVIKLDNFSIVAAKLPMDWDGFYYLQEISYRLSHHQGYYHSFSVFFSWAEWMARLFHLTPLTAFNTIFIFSLLIFAFSIGWLALTATSSWKESFYLFLAAFHSNILLYFHFGFLKQASAMALGTLAIAILTCRPKSSVYLHFRWLMSAALMILAVLIHPFAIVLSVAYLAFFNLKACSNISRYGYIVLGLGLGILSFSYGAYFYTKLSILLSTCKIQPFLISWNWLRDLHWINYVEYMEYWIYFVFSIAVISISVFIQEKKRIVILWAVYLFMILPVWNQEWGGFAVRLTRSSPWIFYLSFVSSLGLFESVSLKIRLLKIFNRVYMFALIGVLILWGKGNHSFGPPINVKTVIKYQSLLKDWFGENAFVKTIHGVQYIMTYHIGCSSAREFPNNLDTYKKIFVMDNRQPDSLMAYPLDRFTDSIPDSVRCVLMDGVYFYYIYRIDSCQIDKNRDQQRNE